MKDFKLSPSKIVLYHKCPRKFYYRYVEKIVEPNTPETIRGTIFHKILEDLYKVIDFSKFYGKHWTQIGKELGDLMITYLELEWSKIGSEYDNVFKDEEESKKFLEETKEFIAFYCLKEGYRLYYFFKKNKPGEQWFNKNLEREFMPRSTEEYINVENVQGYIDKTINVFGRGVGIVDYKTSKTSLPHAIDDGHVLQLKVYSYLHYKKTGEMPLHMSIYYSKTGESVYQEARKEDIKEVQEVIDEIRSKKKDKQDFPKNITKLCDYCYFKNICKPYSKEQDTAAQ